MVITLYQATGSPPSRNVELTLKALKIKYEKKEISLQNGEQKTPEYLAMNPRGKVPCLKDGDFVISESRAISTYLCNQYEKEDDSARLYPTDPKTRGLVDQLLYISENTNDTIVSYVNIGGVIFGNDTKPKEEKLGDVTKALDLYEEYLKNSEFIAGNHLTIADFYMVSPLLLLPLAGYKESCDHKATFDWLKKIKSLSYFEECSKKGLDLLSSMYKEKLQI